MIRMPDESEPAVVVEADCATILPSLPDGCADAIVTDPPFGIGFKYAGHDDTPEGYGRWLWSMLVECERLCKPGSPVFVWQAMLNVRRFSEWFPRDFRLFAAAKNFVQMRPVAMQHAFDPVVVWWTPGAKPWSDKKGNRDYHVANTAVLVSKPDRPERGHPCPRPLDQVRHVVERWVRPGGLVVDPFGGSGTTAVAASETGRRCLLIEKEPAYVAIARRRIAAARGELFAGLTATG